MGKRRVCCRRATDSGGGWVRDQATGGANTPAQVASFVCRIGVCGYYIDVLSVTWPFVNEITHDGEPVAWKKW